MHEYLVMGLTENKSDTSSSTYNLTEFRHYANNQEEAINAYKIYLNTKNLVLVDHMKAFDVSMPMIGFTDGIVEYQKFIQRKIDDYKKIHENLSNVI